MVFSILIYSVHLNFPENRWGNSIIVHCGPSRPRKSLTAVQNNDIAKRKKNRSWFFFPGCWSIYHWPNWDFVPIWTIMSIWKGIWVFLLSLLQSTGFKGISLGEYQSQEAAGIYHQTWPDAELFYNSAVVGDMVLIIFS